MTYDETQTSLLQAVRDGADVRAWDNFYRIYSSLIRNFAMRMSLPDADAEDVVQEVIVVAHRSLKSGTYNREKGTFRNWLYGITRRQSLAKLRERHRRTRAQGHAPDTGVDLLDQIEDREAEERAAALWQQEWRYALLDEALHHVQSQVGDKAFRAFVLHCIEHRSVEQVAAELDIAPASVYVYKGRVLKTIKEWTRQFEDDL